MPATKHVPLAEAENDRKALEKLTQSVGATLSLSEYIERMAPAITDARKQNVPAIAIYDLLAKRIGCSADVIQRHYRKTIKRKR
ncbi:MAG: hypothetical protein ACYDHD_00190 [Vulcanimicrobiaceae bacterium]